MEPRCLPGNSKVLYLVYSNDFFASAVPIHMLQKAKKNAFQHEIQQEFAEIKEEKSNTSLPHNVKWKISSHPIWLGIKSG